MFITRLKTVVGVILVLALLGIGTGFGLWHNSAIGQAPAPPPPIEIQRQNARGPLEYKALTRTEIEMRAPKEAASRLTDGLNDLAGTGWELVAIDAASARGQGNAEGSTYIFRRAKAGPVLPPAGAVR